MDKKLLDSLNNLSLALEEIADALKEKKESNSATGKALQVGDFITEIKEINIGVKNLQKDTTKILANQETIMSMAKKSSSESKDITEELGKDKKKQNAFKEGIGVIMLIAVAVLAIGAAFKIIGDVNFLSVITLSLALPILAIGFSKVHTTLKKVGFDAKTDGKNFIIAVTSIAIAITLASLILSTIMPISFNKFLTATFIALTFSLLAPSIYKFIMTFKEITWTQLAKAAVGLPIILTSISIGIAASSWVLSLIKPIGISQFSTAIAIGTIFAVISFGFSKLLHAFKKIGTKDLLEASIFLPRLLPAIALSIAISSLVLQLTKPINFTQLLTAILIAGVFTVISFGFSKLLQAFKGMSPALANNAAFIMPIILIAFSAAIAGSSFFFANIKIITLPQFLTAIGIAAVFTIIAFGIKPISEGINKMKWDDIPKLPVFFIAVSMAIMLSSYILSKTKVIPFNTLLKIAALSVALSIAVAAIGGVMWILNKMKLNVEDALMGSLLIVVIATTIMLSSHILSLGNYGKFPSFKWALGVGTSLILFSTSIIALGLVAISGMGALAILAGSGMALVVASTIVAVSYIIAKGKYETKNIAKWTLNTVPAFLLFTPILLALGVIALSGIGLIAFLAGREMAFSLANTIVDISNILSKGKYDIKGMNSWAKSVALLYLTFTPILIVLGTVGLMAEVIGFFGPNPWELAKSMMVEIASTIVAVSFVLARGKYEKGPTKEWASGISTAIGAFAPVYMMLIKSKIFEALGVGGVGFEDYKKAILTISSGIVIAAQFFAKNSVAFKNGPPPAWAKGVGTAIGAFAPVFEILNNSGGWFKKKMKVEDMTNAIVTISKGIIIAAYFFAQNKAPFKSGNYPSKKWGEGVGTALNAFAPVFKALHEDTGWFTSGEDVIQNMTMAIREMSWAIVSSAKVFNTVPSEGWKNYPTKQWALGVERAINTFIGVYQRLSEQDVSSWELSLVTMYAEKLSDTARVLGKNEKYFNAKINPNFVKGIEKNFLDYASLLIKIEKIGKPKGKKSFISGINDAFGIGDRFGDPDDPVQRIARGIIFMAKAYDILAKSVDKFSKTINKLDPIKISAFSRLTGNIALLSAMDHKMFDNMMKVLERRSGVFADMLKIQASETTGVSFKSKDEKEDKKGSGEPKTAASKGEPDKMDIIIHLLSSINRFSEETSDSTRKIKKKGFFDKFKNE